MQIIKKIDNSMPMPNFNESLRCSPCYGACVQSKYSAAGELTIKGINGLDFAEELIPSSLELNIHLFNERKLSQSDYAKIANNLARINSFVILSSSQLSRQTLNEFRTMALECQDVILNRIVVASGDDLSNKNGDMIYSGRLKSKNDYEFDRLTEYAKSGIPVLLDWQDNYDRRISKMIEKTNGSNKLIVLSNKPKTTRRTFNEFIR